MERLEDKIIIAAGCFAVAMGMGMDVPEIAALLYGVTFTCLYEYCRDRRLLYGGCLMYLSVLVFVPGFLLLLPLIFYDLAGSKAERKEIHGLLLFLPAALAVLIIHVLTGRADAYAALFLLCITGGACYLAVRTKRLLWILEDYKEQRDSSRELELQLKEKNRTLIETQDYEIRLATLKERNRIAREIHDNVGHMLSRSILQTAALGLAVREDAVKEQLKSLSDTLNLAMDSIRESVHDLHDDSLNLENAIRGILKEYPGYQMHYDYEISSDISREIKYCMLTVVKEALSNVVKHSSASAIRIVVQEFQNYYQMLFQDNGESANREIGARGMGLDNMKERVQALGGTLHIRREGGFRIFVSIPKN